ncbi:MAG: penicillin-binding transpeptidase domain-containing protein [Candidatus Sericytochromatia bacterium]
MRRAAALGTAFWLLLAANTDARDFQARCEALLGARAGAIVACEIESGRLLALVNPATAEAPLPPGSAFKPVTALAALAGGFGAAERLTCRGAYAPLAGGRALPCWQPGGHGRLTLEEAIARSCNVAFYQLGERVGSRAILAQAAEAGLGAAPGWRKRIGPEAAPALAVGEGLSIAVTARQLAGLACAIASDGRVRRVAWAPEAPGGAIAEASDLARVREGLRLAALFGSARGAAAPGLSVAGKTGTATYTDGSNRTYGWFVGYMPAERPRVAVVVLLKEANGFAGAAPLAGRVFAAYEPE